MGVEWGVFSPVPSFPSLLSLSVFPPRNGPSNPAEGFGERCWLRFRERTTFAATRHVSWALNTQKMRLPSGAVGRPQKNFWCIMEPRECVWWLPMSSGFCYTNSKTAAMQRTWLFLGVLYATVYSLIKLCLIVYILFRGGSVSTPSTLCYGLGRRNRASGQSTEVKLDLRVCGY